MNTRPAKEFRYSVPTRKQVREILNELQNGHKTADEVSSWAMEFVLYDDPQICPEITDQLVWETIHMLSGSDLQISDGIYFHSGEDFESWLIEYDKKCGDEPTAT